MTSSTENGDVAPLVIRFLLVQGSSYNMTFDTDFLDRENLSDWRDAHVFQIKDALWSDWPRLDYSKTTKFILPEANLLWNGVGGQNVKLQPERENTIHLSIKPIDIPKEEDSPKGQIPTGEATPSRCHCVLL